MRNTGADLIILAADISSCFRYPPNSEQIPSSTPATTSKTLRSAFENPESMVFYEPENAIALNHFPMFLGARRFRESRNMFAAKAGLGTFEIQRRHKRLYLRNCILEFPSEYMFTYTYCANKLADAKIKNIIYDSKLADARIKTLYIAKGCEIQIRESDLNFRFPHSRP
jgi:hypothetical protein